MKHGVLLSCVSPGAGREPSELPFSFSSMFLLPGLSVSQDCETFKYKTQPHPPCSVGRCCINGVGPLPPPQGRCRVCAWVGVPTIAIVPPGLSACSAVGPLRSLLSQRSLGDTEGSRDLRVPPPPFTWQVSCGLLAAACPSVMGPACPSSLPCVPQSNLVIVGN